jgi:hypothetical protein
MTSSSKPGRQSVNPDFGETLPQASRDERGDDSPHDDADRDRWMRDNVPPHHS